MPKLDQVKQLRESTGAGLADIKSALTEAKGDADKAKTILRQKGQLVAEQRAGKVAKAGLVDGYIHMGRIGALVEVNCETDFVARTDEFKTFVHEVAMQVAASDLRTDDVSALLEQPTIADESQTVADKLNELSAKLSEKIVIARFTRYELGG